MDPFVQLSDPKIISKEYEILYLIDEAIFELDKDCNFIFLNAKAENIWKRSSGYLLGKELWKEFPDQLISPLYVAVERTLREKTRERVESFFPLTGRRISVRTIPSQAGVLIVLSDIQEEWENRQKLKEGELKLKEAQEIGHIGSFEWDLAENKIMWSDELYLIHGLQPQSVEMNFEKLLSFMPDEDQQGILNGIQHTQRTGKPFNLMHRIVRADGALRYVQRRGLIIRNEPLKIYGTVQDITEQKLAELELKESKELLQSIFNASPNSITVFNTIYTKEGDVEDFVFFRVNEFTLKLSGLNNKDLIGKKLSQLFPKTFKIGVFDQFQKVALTGEMADFEKWYEGDGFHNWFRFIVTKLDNLLVVTTEDITARKNAEQELKDSKEFIEKVSSTIPDLISIRDTRTEQLAYTNHDRFWLEYNKPFAEANKMKDYERAVVMVHPDHLEKAKLFLKERRILPDKKITEVELRMINESWVKQRSMVFKRDDQGNTTQILSITTNITEQKEAEEKLVKLKLSQQKVILNAVLNAQEEDRKNIAEALHNDLGQLLYAVKLKAESIQPDPKIKDQTKLMFEVDRLLQEAIDKTRNLSFQLTPQLLETFGLKDAVDAMTIRCQTDKLFINFKYISETERHHPDLEITVFRIVQELINNIVKHSKASIATIRIESENNFLKITVKDNGIGFNKEILEQKESGMGMLMIQNRVKLMNGTVSIDSNEKSGTKILIIFTISERKH